MTQKTRTSEIITYDNHFNGIRTFNLLNEKSQDLFFAIIESIQKIDTGLHNPIEKKYRLRCKDVCSLGGIINKKTVFSSQQLEQMILDINIHVPYIMYITYPQNEYIDVTVTAKLQKLFWDIAADAEVTQFKLSSFIAMQSKYAKALYRLLLATSRGSDHGICCQTITELAERIGTENSEYLVQNIKKIMEEIASTGDLSEATYGRLHFQNLYFEHNPPDNPDQILINYVWSPDRLK